MPDGLTHAKYHRRFIPFVAGAAAAGAVYGAAQNLFLMEVSLSYFVWYLAGRYVDPDWDQAGVTAAEGRIQRELYVIAPPIMAATAFYASTIYLLVKIFRVKGAIGGTHRTWLTHSIIPGTLTRMLVICLAALFVVNFGTFLAGYSLNTMILPYMNHIYAVLLGMFLGLAHADLIHIVLDKIYGGD